MTAELSAPVNLTAHANIKPACLPTDAGSHYGGQLAVVSGWGTVGSGASLNSALHQVSVTVFNDSDCGRVSRYMTRDMICAGVKEGGRDSCQGDSGGPLVTTDQNNNQAATLIGVVSWGFGCAEADSLGVYSEVSHFLDWLLANMPSLSTCPPPALSTWSVPPLSQTSEGLKPTTTSSTTSSTTTTVPTTTTTTPVNDLISLIGGPNEFEGTILLGGRPVCDDLWSGANARVACRMLGLSGGQPVQGSYFTSAGDNFVLDNVVCSGSELSLTDCQYSTSHNCHEWEAAGVKCRQNDEFGNAIATNVALTGGFSAEQGNVLVNGRPVWYDKIKDITGWDI